MDSVIIAAIVSGFFALIAATIPILIKWRRGQQRQTTYDRKILLSESKRPSYSGARRGNIIDLSHGQSEWRGFHLFRHLNCDKITHEFLDERKKIEQSRCLLLPLPWRCSFSRDEIDYIENWVSEGGGLFLLGFYLGDSHHVCNINAIARRFNFEFCEDLIMPLGRTSLRDCLSQAFEPDNPDLSVIIRPRVEQDHPIGRRIQEVYFLSSCSLKLVKPLQKFDLVLKTPDAAVMHAIGYKDPDGWMIKIDDYDIVRKESVPILAAWSHGAGKIAAAGTWKICSQDRGDNTILVDNVLSWLTA